MTKVDRGVSFCIGENTLWVRTCAFVMWVKWSFSSTVLHSTFRAQQPWNRETGCRFNRIKAFLWPWSFFFNGSVPTLLSNCGSRFQLCGLLLSSIENCVEFTAKEFPPQEIPRPPLPAIRLWPSAALVSSVTILRGFQLRVQSAHNEQDSPLTCLTSEATSHHTSSKT